MQIRAFAVADTEAVLALWQACDLLRPWNDPRRDIERKLTVHPELFLLGTRASPSGAQIVASAMFGYDGHRGWLNYLGVHPHCQRQGLAAQLMAHGQALLLQRGCPKLNLQVRADNAAVLAFYQKLGFQADPVASLGRRLIDDQAAATPPN